MLADRLHPCRYLASSIILLVCTTCTANPSARNQSGRIVVELAVVRNFFVNQHPFGQVDELLLATRESQWGGAVRLGCAVWRGWHLNVAWRGSIAESSDPKLWRHLGGLYGELAYMLGGHRPLRPYLLAGAGWCRRALLHEDANPSEVRPGTVHQQFGWSYLVGAGAQLRLARHWSLRLGFLGTYAKFEEFPRRLSLPTEVEFSAGPPFDPIIRRFELEAGLGYWF